MQLASQARRDLGAPPTSLFLERRPPRDRSQQPRNFNNNQNRNRRQNNNNYRNNRNNNNRQNSNRQVVSCNKCGSTKVHAHWCPNKGQTIHAISTSPATGITSVPVTHLPTEDRSYLNVCSSPQESRATRVRFADENGS